jgi:uncharacterized protein YjbJ (UPF0337 family)
MINAQEIQGQWTRIRGKVKEKWGQLSDDDLTIQGGNVDQLVGRIQQRTGEGREAIEKFLTGLTASGASAIAQATETAREYTQQAGAYLSQAGDRLREGYGRMGDVARERYEIAEDMVRHNPAQTVAAAFGLGLVFGVVVGLALRSR